MISSLDGRLQIERYSKLHNAENQNLALEIYLDLGKKIDSDAWMIGKGTVQSMGLNDIFKTETNILVADFSPFVVEKNIDRFCVIFDAKGKIRFTDNTFEGDNIIVVLGESVTVDYLDFLKDMGISYLFAGKDGYDLNIAMNTLYNHFGIRRVRLEGGGILNGTFLKAGLIDKLSILLYPGIDGLSGISSIFEYKGTVNDLPANGQSLELKNIEKFEAGLIWLQYDVHN